MISLTLEPLKVHYHSSGHHVVTKQFSKKADCCKSSPHVVTALTGGIGVLLCNYFHTLVNYIYEPSLEKYLFLATWARFPSRMAGFPYVCISVFSSKLENVPAMSFPSSRFLSSVYLA